MEFVITLSDKGKLLFMREESGEDAYTDDIGQAVIFIDKNEVLDTLREGEEYWPILRDDDGGIEGIDRLYKH